MEKEILTRKRKARERELIGARDVAWTAYRTVACKMMEMSIAAQGQDDVVKVARVAAEPSASATSRKVMNMGIALVLGLLVGVFAAVAVEYFKNQAARKNDIPA
ncbi:MAG: hypothetical protein FJ008_09035 [Chloroflexi bacterium]|nr:hypothetical protein [Chloroflexota bacterium]